MGFPIKLVGFNIFSFGFYILASDSMLHSQTVYAMYLNQIVIFEAVYITNWHKQGKIMCETPKYVLNWILIIELDNIQYKNFMESINVCT